MGLWLAPAVFTGMCAAVFAAAFGKAVVEGQADPVGLLTTGLCCVGVPAGLMGLWGGLMALRSRSMAARLLGLMTELFQDARILDAEAAPPEAGG
jgi:hypothetical protein